LSNLRAELFGLNQGGTVLKLENAESVALIFFRMNALGIVPTPAR